MTVTSSQNHWWQNWSKTHAYVAQKMFFPTSANEIASAIQAAEADHRPLRAIGGGWSFSDASLPGAVITNRPNIHAVDAISKVVPLAIDPSQPGLTSIIGTSTGVDVAGSMRMFSQQLGDVDNGWKYTGLGMWSFGGQAYGTDDDFLNWLDAGGLRPIRDPMGVCLAEADTAGSLVMHDLHHSPQRLRDWFYRGGGVWTAGCFGDPPAQGSLRDLSKAGRLTSPVPGAMNLSPRASRAGDALALLLSKQPTVPATPEPVYLVDTRALSASLQQRLPALLGTAATDFTSAAPAGGGEQRFLFHVEAGITISELGQLLAHQSPRLSLRAISGSPGATLAGALATATHGAEFNWPLLVDTVKAVHLVGPGGVQWWIEGDESIAAETKVKAAYPGIRWIAGATAVQGVKPQDWLSAAVVSMGSMGVLYSVVLEVVPRFGVREVVVEKTWDTTAASVAASPLRMFVGTAAALNDKDLPALLRDPVTSKTVSSRIVTLLQNGADNGTGIAEAANRYADLAINPNRRPDGGWDCWIGNREMTTTVPLDPHSQGDGELGAMLNGISGGLASLQDRDVKLAATYGFGPLLDRFDPVRTVKQLADEVSAAIGKVSTVVRAGDMVDVGLDTVLRPLETPPWGFEVGQALLSGLLAGLLGTANCARRSDKTGVSVGALGFPGSGVMGTALEIAIAPGDAFGFVQTEILDRVVGVPFLGYVSIRLCSRTQSLMGMQQFGDATNPCSVMIEVVAFGTDASRQFVAGLQSRTLARIDTGLDAMLHWGLENDMTAAHLGKIPALQAQSRSGMTKVNTFRAARAAVHAAAPVAFRVFDNAFTDRLGLTTRPLMLADSNKVPLAEWVPTSPFGHLTQDTPARLDGFALLNPGTIGVDVVDLRITSPKDALGPAAVFKLLSPKQFHVDPGTLYFTDVEYEGTEGGPLTGLVEVDCGPGSATVSFPLSASITSLGTPGELQFDAASLDFAGTLIGATTNRVLQIQNSGGTAASLMVVEVTGPAAAQFAVTGGGNNVNAGGAATLTVSFTPLDIGAMEAVLHIQMTSKVGAVVHTKDYELPLTALGLAPFIFLAAEPRPPVRPGPFGGGRLGRELKALDFGVAPPDTDVPGSFWVRNEGNSPLTVLGPVDNKGSFNVPDLNVFPFTVAAGAEHEVPCALHTSAFRGGSASAPLALTSDDPRRGTVTLLGSGRSEGPHLNEPAEFQKELVDVRSGAATLVFQSDGTDPVTVRAIRFARGNSGFAATTVPAIPTQIPPGTTFTVTLTSGQPGATDQLVVTHDGSGKAIKGSQINVAS